MVEFVLALPILLFVIFGIIEFARLTFAWMAVQNSARFGIRYAVTGEFDEVYCVAAGNNLGAAHINADVFGGDPQDCIVPDGYTGTDSSEKERDLIDLARLFSIQDAAVGGGSGLWLDPAVSGDYEQYLANNNPVFIGQTASEGYFHTTICSNRGNQFAVDYNNHAIPLCVDNLNAILMDDAGGPGDRVKVHIEHEHPFFLPILSNVWPSVSISAERDGIVEKFRTSRVVGVSGPILSAPTWTQTPTITDTPTITPTPTATPTTTPTLTPTFTATPIPVNCDLIYVEDSYLTDYYGYYAQLVVKVRNDNPIPVQFLEANQIWQKTPSTRIAAYFKFSPSYWHYVGDATPPTTWVPSSPVTLNAGSSAVYDALFTPVDPLSGMTSVDLLFSNGCHVGVTEDMPTPTPTPVPNCDLYTLSDFTFSSGGIVSVNVVNGDLYDAGLDRIRFDWDYIEDFGAVNGFPNLNTDWFSWNGMDVWGYKNYGWGDGMGEDFSSNTDTSVDSSWSWEIFGDAVFSSGNSHTLRIDFDGNPSNGVLPSVISSDFGLIIDFDNGCQISKGAVPRAIVTYTPTITFTPTQTSTPTNTPTITPTPSPSPTFTSTLTPSITPTPSNTPTPTKTPTASNTPPPTFTPTNTAVPTHTPLPTNTVIPPTINTPMPSSTPLPTSTNTPLPTSTKTPVMTNTPTQIPTWTPACGYDNPNFPCQPSWTPTP